MPANLTPQYQAAEERFRAAQTIEEKIEALREMLSTIPKHKGTEKLQADIKRRLAKCQQEQDQKKKSGGGRRHDPGHIAREGAGQIALIGPPNSGKSSVLGALTHAHPEIADYPFTTTTPLPGMMPYEDVQVQLIDTPPLTGEPYDPVLVNIARNADCLLLVVDPNDPEALEQAEHLRGFLVRSRIFPTGRTVPEEYTVSGRVMPVYLALNKLDLGEDVEILTMVHEAVGSDLPVFRVAAAHGNGLEELRVALYEVLGVLRVYAKEPGKKPDMNRPFVLKHGATVHDLATIIHKDIAASFKYARIWGSAKFEGQQVDRDHPLADRDVVEIHGG